MINILIFLMKVITIIAIIFTTLTSIYNFFYAKKSTIYIINLIFNVFYGLPLILDEVKGKPNYMPTFPGFQEATNDDITQITYLVVINLVLFIFYRYKKNENIKKINIKPNIKINNLERKLLIIPIILPVIYIFFAPDITVYSEYAYFLKNVESGELLEFHSKMWNLTFLSISAIAVYIHSLNNKFNVIKMSILLLPILVFNIWINGKRNIAILTICILIYVYNDKKLFSKKLIVCVSTILLIIGVSFNSIYQRNVRGFDTKPKDVSYTNFRIDYGRDDVMKLAIYSNYNEDKISILEYKGQSLLYYLLFFIPREIWNEKPQPYYVYMVNRSIGYSGNDYLGWGMTVSIFTEFISNIGIISGTILAALSICYLVKVTDSASTTIEKFISFYLAFTLIYNGIKLEFLIMFIMIQIIKFIKSNIKKRCY